MRLATVKLRERNEVRVVVSSDGESWRSVDVAAEYSWARSAKAIIEKSDSVPVRQLPLGDDSFDRAELDFLPPVLGVEKLICIGKNYADHAAEMDSDAPEIPIVFSKFPSCLIGHRANIELPKISSEVDFEAELVVVIGKAGKDIQRSDALSHVFGYTIGNDVSARDWQKGRPGGQWLMGKAFDTFAPLGPSIVTADEVGHPQNLQIGLNLNGQQMQLSNTAQMIFPIDVLLAHVSQFFTLRPGDLIFTGTPSGVGAGRQPKVFLKDGDQVTVEVEKLGVLENNVVASS